MRATVYWKVPHVAERDRAATIHGASKLAQLRGRLQQPPPVRPLHREDATAGSSKQGDAAEWSARHPMVMAAGCSHHGRDEPAVEHVHWESTTTNDMRGEGKACISDLRRHP